MVELERLRGVGAADHLWLCKDVLRHEPTEGRLLYGITSGSVGASFGSESLVFDDDDMDAVRSLYGLL